MDRIWALRCMLHNKNDNYVYFTCMYSLLNKIDSICLIDVGTCLCLSRCLQLTAVGDNHLLARLATLRANRFDLLNDVHALDNGAKDNVLKFSVLV